MVSSRTATVNFFFVALMEACFSFLLQLVQIYIVPLLDNRSCCKSVSLIHILGLLVILGLGLELLCRSLLFDRPPLSGLSRAHESFSQQILQVPFPFLLIISIFLILFPVEIIQTLRFLSLWLSHLLKWILISFVNDITISLNEYVALVAFDLIYQILRVHFRVHAIALTLVVIHNNLPTRSIINFPLLLSGHEFLQSSSTRSPNLFDRCFWYHITTLIWTSAITSHNDDVWISVLWVTVVPYGWWGSLKHYVGCVLGWRGCIRVRSQDVRWGTVVWGFILLYREERLISAVFTSATSDHYYIPCRKVVVISFIFIFLSINQVLLLFSNLEHFALLILASELPGS